MEEKFVVLVVVVVVDIQRSGGVVFESSEPFALLELGSSFFVLLFGTKERVSGLAIPGKGQSSDLSLLQTNGTV